MGPLCSTGAARQCDVQSAMLEWEEVFIIVSVQNCQSEVAIKRKPHNSFITNLKFLQTMHSLIAETGLQGPSPLSPSTQGGKRHLKQQEQCVPQRSCVTLQDVSVEWQAIWYDGAWDIWGKRAREELEMESHFLRAYFLSVKSGYFLEGSGEPYRVVSRSMM